MNLQTYPTTSFPHAAPMIQTKRRDEEKEKYGSQMENYGAQKDKLGAAKEFPPLAQK